MKPQEKSAYELLSWKLPFSCFFLVFIYLFIWLGQVLAVVHGIFSFSMWDLAFPAGSDSKESSCNTGNLGQPLGQEDPLEKGKATHSSILAWRTP